MNKVTKLGLVLSGLLVTGQVGAANANAMTISAASFQDYFNTGSFCVNPVNNGFNNQCSFDTTFAYGIPKGPSTAGYSVTFSGFNNAGVTSTVTVFSNASDGTFLLSQSSNATAAGKWSKAVSFTAAQAPASGRLTALVGLPGNFNAALYGLTVAY